MATLKMHEKKLIQMILTGALQKLGVSLTEDRITFTEDDIVCISATHTTDEWGAAGNSMISRGVFKSTDIESILSYDWDNVFWTLNGYKKPNSMMSLAVWLL